MPNWRAPPLSSCLMDDIVGGSFSVETGWLGVGRPGQAASAGASLCVPVMSRMSPSWVASARETSPVMRPSKTV